MLKTNKQKLLASSDAVIDKEVKIQGTKFDRKRTISQSVINKMQWLKKCGLNTNQIATMCEVSWKTAKYHTDPEWRARYILTSSGKHYGPASNVSERANYKRKLLKANAHVIYQMVD